MTDGWDQWDARKAEATAQAREQREAKIAASRPAMGALRKYCFTVDLRGALRNGKESLNYITETDGTPLHPDLVRARFQALIAQGYDVMPTCDNCDATGRCQGHDMPDEKEATDD